MSYFLKKHNIALPQGARNPNEEPIHDEMCHDLEAIPTQSTTYIIDSRASNHMVPSKESFSALTLSKGPNIHMGDDSHIPAEGSGSVRAKMVSLRMSYM